MPSPTSQSEPLVRLSADSRLLFIGDSITDAARGEDREEHVGHGYVRLIRDWLRACAPDHAPHVLNSGVSGNKIIDLSARWERDVIASDPHVLSIMIGINDVWHGLVPEWRPGVVIDDFIQIYRDLIQRNEKSLPRCKIVLCEPTVIEPGREPKGNEALKPYVEAVNELAGAFPRSVVAVVRTHAAFLSAASARPDIQWTSDGVHPTSSGHMLIARTWLTTLNLF